MALCNFVWKASPSGRGSGGERAGRQVLKLGHAQVGDGDEVAACPEAPSSALGLLQQPIHGLDEGVAAVNDHASDDRIEALLEGGGPRSQRGAAWHRDRVRR